MSHVCLPLMCCHPAKRLHYPLHWDRPSVRVFVASRL